MSGIYLHIPFCKQACSYCDFYFVTRHAEQQNFVDELVREIQSKKDSPFAGEPIETIYFGGGTPSLLKERQIEAIMDAISTTFSLDLKEVTFEMNPDDVSAEYLAVLQQNGINRASMGVQTFNSDLLKFMNRAHTAEEALNCLKLLEESEMDVFTVDLIYGNPGQNLDILQRDIETILSFAPPHISAYSLTIEPRTRLGRQVKLGKLLPPEDDDVADHFDMVVDLFGKAGIYQYEVSNFAKPGSEAIHNSNYWRHKNYIGFGPGAHSFWWDENLKSARRWSNRQSLVAYLESDWKEPADTEYLELFELAEERMMLALRTREGISQSDLAENYNYRFKESQLDYLEKKAEEEKVILDETIRLTTSGLRIADAILLDLLTV